MSKLCSLPWCRKPILNKKQSINFPSDRPNQLAWLDALDAGAWFSIPQETLATGLILCGDHFDARGNVRRRYDDPAPTTPTSAPAANIKIETADSDSDESDEDATFITDETYTPPNRSRTSSRKRSKPIEVKIVHRKKARAAEEPVQVHSYFENENDDDDDSDHHQEITPNPIPQRSSGPKSSLDSIDSERLSKLTEGAIKSGLKPKGDGKPQQRKSISLIEKMEIIRMIDSGLKQAQIAKKLNLRRSTVWTTVSKREMIEQAYSDGAPLRKKVRKGTFDDINQALFAWYQKVKSQNLFVNTKVLLTMAENIANELGRTDFKSTQGWLEKFKQRYNIRFGNGNAKPNPRKKVAKAKKASPEGSADEHENPCNEEIIKSEAIANCLEVNVEDEDEILKKDWLQRMWSHSRIKNQKPKEIYQDKDIFFAEELGFLYRITPKQAWQFKYNANNDLEFSIVDERLTVLMCCNADGSEKRKLLLAGKQEAGMHSNLPADYVVSKDPSNWVTKSIFMRWLKLWDATLELEGRKIILLLSTSPLHTIQPEDVSNIKIVNIPTQLLMALHPVNFGIRNSFRSRYRRLLLEKLVSAEKSNNEAICCRDAVLLLSTAWNEIPTSIIKDAFSAAGYIGSLNKDEVSLRADEIDCANLLSKATEMGLAAPQSKYSFLDYVGIDDSLCAVDCSSISGRNVSSSESIVSRLDADFDHDEDQEEDSHFENSPVRSNLSTTDAQNYVSNLRTWAMSRRSCPQQVHNALSTLESFILGHS